MQELTTQAIISSKEFTNLMRYIGLFHQSTRFAVAVSGGPDSLCLIYLMQKWSHCNGHQVTALIVDHGLRVESTGEALTTFNQLQAAGITAVILKWEGAKPFKGIQEKAREARYSLMTQWCHDNKCMHLCIGHHAQDQLETIIWRIARGSTLRGAAGMAVVTQNNGINICRPLLSIDKKKLQRTLEQSSLKPIYDPSNLNRRFTRVQIRHRLEQFPELPVKALGRLRQTFEQWCLKFINDYVTVSPFGALAIQAEAFYLLTQPFQEYVLNHLMQVLVNRIYPPAPQELYALLKHLTDRNFKARTLHGCVIFRNYKEIFIAREWTTLTSQKIISHQQIEFINWHYFIIKFIRCHDNLVIKPIGLLGWQQICAQNGININFLKNIPYHIRLALPAVWKDGCIKQLCHFPDILGNEYDHMSSILKLELNFRIDRCFQPSFL